jgi:hypothetical protein
MKAGDQIVMDEETKPREEHDTFDRNFGAEELKSATQLEEVTPVKEKFTPLNSDLSGGEIEPKCDDETAGCEDNSRTLPVNSQALEPFSTHETLRQFKTFCLSDAENNPPENVNFNIQPAKINQEKQKDINRVASSKAAKVNSNTSSIFCTVNPFAVPYSPKDTKEKKTDPVESDVSEAGSPSRKQKPRKRNKKNKKSSKGSENDISDNKVSHMKLDNEREACSLR